MFFSTDFSFLGIFGCHIACNNTVGNSIAFGNSTLQRIYPKQHTPKIG